VGPREGDHRNKIFAEIFGQFDAPCFRFSNQFTDFACSAEHANQQRRDAGLLREVDVGKTMRLALEKMHRMRINVAGIQPPLKVDESPDYVIAIEGDEPMRIIRDAKEDLHAHYLR